MIHLFTEISVIAKQKFSPLHNKTAPLRCIGNIINRIMKNISAGMFFSVVWRGICQALGWFLGLFGYKRDGKFAKCVWGMFAIGSALFMLFVAIAWGVKTYYLLHNYYKCRNCHSGYCYYDRQLSPDVVIHEGWVGGIAVKNTRTDNITLKNLYWIVRPQSEADSLLLFSTGKLRGYFNRYTAEVVVPAQYSHAWIFSEGIASVEKDSVVMFIDAKGNKAFDRTFVYNPGHEGYVFHAGHCIVDGNYDGKYGLMNTKGVTVIPEEFDSIVLSDDLLYWTLSKGNQSCVIDSDFKSVIPMMECSIVVCSDAIDVTMPDNTIRKYDLKGNLINDFYITGFEHLEYELEESYLYVDKEYDDHSVAYPEHKRARAGLCLYRAGNLKVGLMTPDGRMVTLPKYESIGAVEHDLYQCHIGRGIYELLNDKGQLVR